MARLSRRGIGSQSDLPTRELAAGSTYWSVFSAEFPATSFNPNKHGDPELGTVGGRFHPFESPPGTRIPTKYLADHENGAFAETMLRDVPGERDVTLAEITSRRIARLGLRCSLRVVDLTEPASDSVLGRLLQRGHEAYPTLRSVAATLHERHADIEGLLWEGYQLAQPGMKCLVLFGDRVSGDDDLDEIEVFELDDGIGLRTLRAAARLRRFTLPKALAIDDVSQAIGTDRRRVKPDISSSPSPSECVDTPLSTARTIGTRSAANDEDVNPPTPEQAEYLRELYRTEEYSGFELFYQPQLRIPGRLVCGFEALLRWRSSDGGFVGAHDLIPLAERAGRSHAIHEWVLRTACREAASWPKTLSVAVNVSSREFKNKWLIKSLGDALEHSGLAPERLEIEITESSIEDSEFAFPQIETIRAMGVSITIDDFGTGYSSLGQLVRLPISKIEIDRSFMCGEPTERSRAIVDALITLGVSIGVETVVEGVETPEQLAHLEAGHRCIVQGYLISRPIPATEIVNFLEKGRDADGD